ncbi:MAG: hypothetical protein IJK98_09220, partial [Clostridia bacterium]|nr:hypothetical protein [Clostridia bacterium]
RVSNLYSLMVVTPFSFLFLIPVRLPRRAKKARRLKDSSRANGNRIMKSDQKRTSPCRFGARRTERPRHIACPGVKHSTTHHAILPAITVTEHLQRLLFLSFDRIIAPLTYYVNRYFDIFCFFWFTTDHCGIAECGSGGLQGYFANLQFVDTKSHKFP